MADSKNHKRQAEILIDEVLLKKAALVLRATNHKLRQKMLQYIHKKGAVPVTEVYRRLHLTQSVTSQHLAVLRRADLVITKRDGKSILYSVNYGRVDQVHRDVRELLGLGG